MTDHNYSDEYLLTQVDTYGMKNGDYRFTFKNLSNRYLDPNEVIKCYTGPRRQVTVWNDIKGTEKKWAGYYNWTNGWQDVLDKGVGHVWSFKPKMHNPRYPDSWPNWDVIYDWKNENRPEQGQIQRINGDSQPVWVREDITFTKPVKTVKKKIKITTNDPNGLFQMVK